MPLLVRELCREVERLAHAKFTGVLLNLYKDGSNSIAWHSDDEPEMGPVIASLSLGSSRTFRMRRKTDHKHTQDFALGDGDVLIMRGSCQIDWEHCVPKTKRHVFPRINLTFRQLTG
jgi:alkylated DNA repair dioxygenase AlkB